MQSIYFVYHWVSTQARSKCLMVRRSLEGVHTFWGIVPFQEKRMRKEILANMSTTQNATIRFPIADWRKWVKSGSTVPSLFQSVSPTIVVTYVEYINLLLVCILSKKSVVKTHCL